MADDKDTASPTKAKGVTSDENVKFLISCIKYAQNGKINFEDVAQECDIVSKGAAAKRYERLLKAHGVNPADIRSAGEAKNSNSSKKTPKSKATQTEENDNDEDGEDVPPESPTKAKKQRTPAAKKNGVKKRKLDDDKLADKETEDIKMEDEEAEPEV